MVTLHMKDARNFLAERVKELRTALRERDTAVLAANTGASFQKRDDESRVFHLTVWGHPAVVTWPDFIGRDPVTDERMPAMAQAMLAYYFHTSDGTPQTGEWIAFTDLPDGRIYAQAFQGYTGQELAKAFGNNIAAFSQTAGKLNGRPVPFADAAFVFPFLPRVSLLVAGWQGDEDFPPSYRVLFDTAVSHHLPTDACAILGSTLTQKFIRAKITSEQL